ncbi:YceI family protein [Pontibacter diazotrophicus]|uniref:YceI family protein n=1 Tax=Pontibacter diazotrophicus TaxID=1400979 RepID=A0A3D8LDM1_9BACT|nr:YceI family protein [Pontibacter diazotrophicus]RDV15505.1 YceI family protein [Pontibacter diazotrophicus]
MAKLHLHSLYLLLSGVLLLTFSACDTTIKTDEAIISEAVEKKSNTRPANTFVVDTAKSEVTWIGAKMTGRHNGVFRIQNGELHMQEGLLIGGDIIMDVANTRSEDKTIDEASNKKLTTHLRSADFFDVEKHPTAAFEVTSVSRIDSTREKKETPDSKITYSELRIKDPTHRITGNLTIKGETKSVTFPARVTLDSLLRAKANFNIDRTKWGLVYRSDESLGDKTIYPEVNIGIDLVAKPVKN